MKLSSVLLTVLLLALTGYTGDGKDLWWQSGETFLEDKFTSGDGVSDNNQTLICAARTVATSGQTPYSPAVTNVVKAFRLVTLVLVSVGGACLNVLVIYLVAKHKQLQTLSYSIALQVSVLDILLSVTFALPIVVTDIAGEWVLGTYVCVAVGYLGFLPAFIRTGLMLVFVIDRFLSVFTPFFYSRHRVKIAVSLSVFTWVSLITGRLVALPGILDCYGFTSSFNTCFNSSACNSSCSVFSAVLVLLIFVPTTAVSSVLYAVMYCKARCLRKETATLTGGEMSEEDCKRARRATVTFFLLFLTLFAVTFPASIIQIAIARAYPSNVPPGAYMLHVASGLMGYLLVVSDPIVMLRDRDMREMLSRWKWCPKWL